MHTTDSPSVSVFERLERSLASLESTVRSVRRYTEDGSYTLAGAHAYCVPLCSRDVLAVLDELAFAQGISRYSELVARFAPNHFEMPSVLHHVFK